MASRVCRGEHIPRLGDEAQLAGAKTRGEREAALVTVTRAYQQLAVTLQNQGLSDAAATYAYRSQQLRQRMFLLEGRLGAWSFAFFLNLLAGYGYRMGRILVAYFCIVLLCAATYFVLGVYGYGPIFAPHEALLVSLTAFHGRVFVGGFGVTTPQAWVAAIEAICGLVVESVFIAMLAQRTFGR